MVRRHADEQQIVQHRSSRSNRSPSARLGHSCGISSPPSTCPSSRRASCSPRSDFLAGPQTRPWSSTPPRYSTRSRRILPTCKDSSSSDHSPCKQRASSQLSSLRCMCVDFARRCERATRRTLRAGGGSGIGALAGFPGVVLRRGRRERWVRGPGETVSRAGAETRFRGGPRMYNAAHCVTSSLVRRASHTDICLRL